MNFRKANDETCPTAGDTEKSAPAGILPLPDPPGHASIAKITLPKCAGILPRRRLFRILDSFRKCPVTWISAPAGSGKTTLIASYLSKGNVPNIWYSLDERDEDIATFFYYLGLAAKKAAPHKRNPLPLLTPEYFSGITAFTLRYFENLYARLKPPFTIVFDNYQHVPEQSGLHDAICRGLELLPEELRVIFISRELPPVGFARLRVNGRISFLLAEDIFFTLNETKLIVQQKSLGGFSGETLRLMHERTHGWAAGLMLMMEDITIRGFRDQILGNHTPQEIFDYFAEEIYATLKQGTRDFLLKTAFLPGMTEWMAERLTANERSREILARLQRGHLFTEKNSEPDPVYQYHPLFREFLLARARSEMTEEQVRGIRRISARLLEESGQIEEAADFFFMENEWGEMIRLILSHAKNLVAQGRNNTLEEWLKKLPEPVFNETPWLPFWMGICRMTRAPGESLAFFETSFKGFGARNDAVGEFLAWSGAVGSILIAWDNFILLDPWIEWLDRRMAQNGSFPTPEIGARVATGMVGALIWRRPYRSDIRGWLQRALSLSRQTGDVNLQLHAMHHAGAYYFWTGDFTALDSLSQREKEIARTPDASPMVLLLWKTAEPMRKAISSKYYGEVIDDVAECLDIAEKSGLHIFDHWLFAHGIYGSFNVRDMELSVVFLRKMQALLEGGSRHVSGHYHFLLAWYKLLTGNSIQALSFAEKSLQVVLDSGISPSEIVTRQLMAKILHENGESDKALHQVGIAAALACRVCDEGFFYYLCLLTEARIRFDRGEENTGLELLRKAMEMGRRHGYMTMMYCWQPQVMAEFCKRALESGIETEYAKEFIRSFELFPDTPPIGVEGWPWPVKIYTCGKFAMLIDGQPAPVQGKVQKKPLLLLKALIALGGRNVREEQLTDLLWPGADGDLAHNALKTNLLRLRRLMGNDRALEVHEGAVSLNHRYCWVDTWALKLKAGRFEAVLKENPEAAIDENGENIALAREFIDLYGGPFLPGEENLPWIQPLRERLRERFAALVIMLGTRLEATGEWEKAAEYYQLPLSRDEVCDEELYQRLMTCHYRLGQHSRGVEVYKRCKNALARMLLIKPSPKTEAIYRDLIMSAG